MSSLIANRVNGFVHGFSRAAVSFPYRVMIARRKDFKDAYLLIAKSKRPTLEGLYRLPEAINEDSQTAPFYSRRQLQTTPAQQ